MAVASFAALINKEAGLNYPSIDVLVFSYVFGLAPLYSLFEGIRSLGGNQRRYEDFRQALIFNNLRGF